MIYLQPNVIISFKMGKLLFITDSQLVQFQWEFSFPILVLIIRGKWDDIKSYNG